MSNCYLRSREPHGGGVISDLLCTVFQFTLYCFYLYHCLRGLFDQDFYRSFFKLDLTFVCSTLIQQTPRCTLPRASRALLPTLQWTDGRCCCRRYHCLLAHILLYTCLVVLPINLFRSNHSSLSRCSDKLVASYLYLG